MTQKKSFSLPAGQSDLFGLLSTGNAVLAKVETPPSLAIKPTLSTQPADPALPDGWKEEDIRFLLGVLEDGPILVADSKLGIPTIHEDFGAEVVHCGYGVMKAKGPGFKIIFDAGGGMERTPSGKGWTRLTVEGKAAGPFKYDKTEVRKKLMSYLPATDAPQIEPADLPPAPPEETARNQTALAALTRDRSATLPSAKIPVKEQVKEFNSNLGYFTGTEKWTRYTCLCPHIVLLTDGALYVAEHGGEDGNSAFWLIDAVASYQGEAVLKHHDFQVWKLSVLPPDSEIPPTSVAAMLRSKQPEAHNPYRHAVLTCTNGNEKELVRQEIELTDFLPIGEITMYASVEKHPDISGSQQVMILLLPSEY